MFCPNHNRKWSESICIVMPVWLLKRLFYFVGMWGLIFYILSTEYGWFSRPKTKTETKT